VNVGPRLCSGRHYEVPGPAHAPHRWWYSREAAARAGCGKGSGVIVKDCSSVRMNQPPEAGSRAPNCLLLNGSCSRLLSGLSASLVGVPWRPLVHWAKLGKRAGRVEATRTMLSTISQLIRTYVG
jgi:hypothetical protein